MKSLLINLPVGGLGVVIGFIVANMLGYSERKEEDFASSERRTIVNQEEAIDSLKTLRKSDAEVATQKTAHIAKIESLASDQRAKLAAQEAEIASLKEQLSSRPVESGIKCPVTGVPLERQAQAQGVFKLLSDELRAAKNQQWDDAVKSLPPEEIARGACPERPRITREDFQVQRSRAYNALSALWNKATLDRAIEQARNAKRTAVGVDGGGSYHLWAIKPENRFAVEILQVFGFEE